MPIRSVSFCPISELSDILPYRKQEPEKYQNVCGKEWITNSPINIEDLGAGSMTVVEYGQQNAEVILLLHGGGLSWWNYREAAKLLQAIAGSSMELLSGLRHGDLSINHPKAYAQMLTDWIGR